MPLTIQRLHWLFMRSLMVLAAVLSVATFSLSAFVLAPLYSWLLFGDLRFWRYLAAFPRVTRQVRRFGLKLLFESRYRGMTAFTSLSDWLGPPATGPDLSRVRIRSDWPHHPSSCGACGRCCDDLSCPLFNSDNHLCAAYDSPFWRYFPCGRYPATQSQIDYYACPKWEITGPDVIEPQAAGQLAPVTSARRLG